MFFRGFVNSLFQLFENSLLTTYSNGSVISRLSHEKVPSVYFIKYGYVKCYTINDDGEELILMILGRNDIFPIVSLANNHTGYRYKKIFFEALGTAKILEIPEEQLAAKVKNDINVTTAILQIMGERFFVSVQRIENLSHKGAYFKLVHCLHFLAKQYGHKQGDTAFLDSVFTHKLIANTINLTRGTVTREFEKLRDKDLVSNNKRRIYIGSMQRLSAEIDDLPATDT